MGDYTKKSLFYINSAGHPVYVGDIVEVKELDPYKKLEEENKVLKYDKEYLEEKVRCLEEKCDCLEAQNIYLRQEIQHKRYYNHYEKALKLLYPRNLTGHLTHGYAPDKGYFIELATDNMNPADHSFVLNLLREIKR